MANKQVYIYYLNMLYTYNDQICGIHCAWNAKLSPIKIDIVYMFERVARCQLLVYRICIRSGEDIIFL